MTTIDSLNCSRELLGDNIKIDRIASYCKQIYTMSKNYIILDKTFAITKYMNACDPTHKAVQWLLKGALDHRPN
jgi:hypothetical protein